MTKGSGQRDPIVQEVYDPNNYRPKDILLDLAYVTGLLANWSHEEGRDLLADYLKTRYGETVKRGENPEGQQMEEERRRRREENNTQRDARILRCSAIILAPKDGYDFILHIHYRARNTTPVGFKAEIGQRRTEVEANKTEWLDAWGEELHAQRTRGAPGDLEDPEPSIILPDGDDEIMVSIEDALKRPAPNYTIPSVPSLTYSGSTKSNELGVESAPEAVRR